MEEILKVTSKTISSALLYRSARAYLGCIFCIHFACIPLEQNICLKPCCVLQCGPEKHLKKLKGQKAYIKGGTAVISVFKEIYNETKAECIALMCILII